MEAEIVRASKFVKLEKHEQEALVSTGLIIPINDNLITHFGNRSKIVLLYGSYGNGKSKFVAQDLIEKCRKDKYFKCFYGRKVYEDIRKSLFDELCTEIEERGLQREFTYSRRDNSTMIITHINGNKFIPYGASEAKNLKSIKDATHIVCEEFDQFNEKDFGFLYSRLRTKKSYTQFYGMFNTEPLIKGHWIREGLLKEQNSDILKIFGTYRDNYFIDQSEYEEKLRTIANGREHVYQSIANGELGINVNNNPFFYAYDDEFFIQERYKIIGDEQWTISFDFNKTPCTLLVGNKIVNIYNIVDVILSDDNIGNMTPLQYCCYIFEKKYIFTNIINRYKLTITGDASGKSGSADMKANSNFYTAILEYLKCNKNQIKVRSRNITHKESQEQCNRFLNKRVLLIFQSAEALTRDIEDAYVTDGKLDDAKKKYGLHIVDAFRYWIDCIMHHNRWQEYLKYL